VLACLCIAAIVTARGARLATNPVAQSARTRWLPSQRVLCTCIRSPKPVSSRAQGGRAGRDRRLLLTEVLCFRALPGEHGPPVSATPCRIHGVTFVLPWPIDVALTSRVTKNRPANEGLHLVGSVASNRASSLPGRSKRHLVFAGVYRLLQPARSARADQASVIEGLIGSGRPDTQGE
jgi:hypothetical protein